MKPWRYLFDWKDGQKRLHFVRVMENSLDFHERLAITNTVFAALWPVMRPLSGRLRIAATLHDALSSDSTIPVSVPNWGLYEKYPPAHVEIPRFSDPSYCREEEIPEMSLQALADWLTRAHAQQLPEGYGPVLDSLKINSARARLLEDPGPFAELVDGRETYAVPVEKREDGLWVSGPWWESVSSPPIAIELDDGGLNDDWCVELRLDIRVYWSPWTEAGFAEAELLKSCLQELEKDGWVAD